MTAHSNQAGSPTPTDERQQSAARTAAFAPLVSSMFKGMDADLRLPSRNPEYLVEYESVDLDTADREQLLRLMRDAPSDRIRYFIFGKYMMRIAIASITEREFL